VAVAHRIEQPILIVEQPVDRIRGAVCPRTIIGRREVGMAMIHLNILSTSFFLFATFRIRLRKVLS